MNGLIKRLASQQPARKDPGKMKCGLCNITANDRAGSAEIINEIKGETEVF